MSDTSQGPGWWQASDGKWYPPEQAPGYQPPAAGAAVPASGGGDTGAADIGDAFTFGWNKFIANVGPIIIALLVGFLVLVVLTIIWFFAVAGIGIVDGPLQHRRQRLHQLPQLRGRVLPAPCWPTPSSWPSSGSACS